MNIKKMLKTVAIIGGVFVLTDLCYLLGKGRALGLLKKYNLTVDEALELVKKGMESDSFIQACRFTIIDMATTQAT